MRTGRILGCLTGFYLGLAGMPAAAARFECRMLDGTVHISVQDLSIAAPGAVQGCALVQDLPDLPDLLPAPAFESAAPPGSSRPSLPEIRWIVRRDPVFAQAASELGVSQAALDPASADLIERVSARHGIDPLLLRAVMAVESGGQARAVSSKGARGLMQIMPATGARFGVEAADLFDPETNINVGARYLRVLQQQFVDRPDLVLAAYNAGESAVVRAGLRIPPFRETQEYVGKVLRRYQNLASAREAGR